MDIVFAGGLAFVGTVLLLVPLLFAGKILSKIIFILTVLVLFGGLFVFFYVFEGSKFLTELVF